MLLLESLFLFLIANQKSVATPEEPELTFERLYQFGKNAYSLEDWSHCVAFFLRALEDFNYFRDETAWCRKICAMKTKFDFENLIKSKEGEYKIAVDLWILTQISFSEVKRALCYLKCYNEKFTEQRSATSSPEVYEQFLFRRPFHYLQYCYWKLEDLPNAVKSAYTYLIANPKDVDTLSNLHFYMRQDGFDERMLIDALRPSYEQLYVEAVEAYNSADWQECVDKFRGSLNAFFDKLEECRLMCESEGYFHRVDEGLPEFSVVYSSLLTSLIRCRSKCIEKLSRINGRNIQHFLASYFDYLHMCQFKIGHGRDVCESVENGLLLKPTNIMMRRNKHFYLGSYNKPELFEPNKRIVDYFVQTELEKRFLDYVDKHFLYNAEGSLNQWHPSDSNLTVEIVVFENILDKALDVFVALEDTFDYSLLDKPLISANECKMLKSYAILYPGIFTRNAELFVEELMKRISVQYNSDLPSFLRLSCSFDHEPTECGRTPFVLGADDGQCSQVFGEHFIGCVAIFCVD